VGDAAVRRSFGTVMSELARTLQREHASEHGTLAAVTAAAVQAVPGAENETITLVVGRTRCRRARRPVPGGGGWMSCKPSWTTGRA